MPTRYIEPGLSMLSGLLAEPVAGWAGLLSGNPDNVEKTRNALTYQPRTAEGKAGMNKLAGLLSDAKTVMVDQNPPVRMALEGYNALADRAGAVSPVLGAAVKTAPTALGLLAGPGTAPVRSAFKNVAKDAYANAGRVPAVRGPLAAQDGMVGFKPEPTDPLRYQSDDVRASVREKMTPEAIQALSKYGSPDDAPLNEVMATLDGVPVSAYEFPQDAALETARRNAVTMLGLPEDNTPMDRARALGFVDEGLLHGTTNDFPAFAESKRQSVYATTQPEIADIYANATGRHKGLREVNAGANVIPLMSRGKRIEVSDFKNGNGGWLSDNLAEALGIPWERAIWKKLPEHGYDSLKISEMDDLGGRQAQYVFPDPKVLRSRFAAFDPARVNENNLLGAADPQLLRYIAGAGLAGLLGAGYGSE